MGGYPADDRGEHFLRILHGLRSDEKDLMRVLDEVDASQDHHHGDERYGQEDSLLSEFVLEFVWLHDQ